MEIEAEVLSKLQHPNIVQLRMARGDCLALRDDKGIALHTLLEEVRISKRKKIDIFSFFFCHSASQVT